MNNALGEAGIKDNEPPPQEDSEEAKRKKAEIEQRGKDRLVEYEKKKAVHAEKKKKLSDAWAANRKANQVGTPDKKGGWFGGK